MKTYMTSTVVGLLLVVASLLPRAAQAQLQEVKQTVFGMDCAPCAYAQENRLKAMEGVDEASVSLNEGLATVKFQPENEITLEQIREAVRESGFSPEEATLTLQGRLEEHDGQWVLVTSAGERYRLEEVGEITSIDTGVQATVTGTVPEGKAPEKGWSLQVTALNTQA